MRLIDAIGLKQALAVSAILEDKKTIGQIIDEQPTIEPERKTGRWIPVTERLPEEREWIGTKIFGTTISDEIYVTFEAPDGQRFADHISFQNGGLSVADVERMRVWYKGAKPIAWKQLPEPYREGQE